jgi:hypothetical protein
MRLAQTWMVVALFAPVYLLLLFNYLRGRRIQALQASRVAPPFAPQPASNASLLLEAFTKPERAYLSRQRNLLLSVYGWFAYASLVILGGSLLPANVDHYGLEQALPQRVWYSYLLGYRNPAIFWLISLVTALIALNDLVLQVPGGSPFIRTRPVSRGVIFWGRIGGIYIAEIAGLATGILFSWFILLAAYGPVWNHLFDTARVVASNSQHLPSAVQVHVQGLTSTMYLTPQQYQHLMLSLQTSAIRLSFAFVGGSALVFSVAVALFALPPRLFGNAQARTLLILLGVTGLQIASVILPKVARIANMLYISPQLGQPPPYAGVLFPVALSVLLLLLARQAVARREL